MFLPDGDDFEHLGQELLLCVSIYFRFFEHGEEVLKYFVNPRWSKSLMVVIIVFLFLTTVSSFFVLRFLAPEAFLDQVVG